jgi:prevent-host-death family protein
MTVARGKTGKKAPKAAKAGEPARGQASATQTAGRPNGSAAALRARPRPATAASGPTVYMTSTEAQNGFGRVLDTVARGGTVLITRRNATQAVVISAERYKALTTTEEPSLDALAAEYDDLLAKMATPAAREGALRAIRSSPQELARIAVLAARNARERG